MSVKVMSMSLHSHLIELTGAKEAEEDMEEAKSFTILTIFSAEVIMLSGVTHTHMLLLLLLSKNHPQTQASKRNNLFNRLKANL